MAANALYQIEVDRVPSVTFDAEKCEEAVCVKVIGKENKDERIFNQRYNKRRT